MYHTLFIHLSVDRHLGSLHVLVIVNSAAMNTGVHTSFSIMFFSGICPVVREGSGAPLQYSCLENPMDGGAWWLSSVGSHSWTQLKRLSICGCIGEGNGNQVQCSFLENPRDRGAWWAAVHGVTQSWTRLKQLSSSSA